MEELNFLILGLTLFSGVSEFIAQGLKKLANKEFKQKVKNGIILFSKIFSLIAVFSLLISVLYFSTTFITTALDEAKPENFNKVLLAFIFLYIMSFVFVHIFGYCFAGLLHKYPFGGRFWPKGIDYFYYAIGSGLLLLLLGEVYQQKTFVASGIKIELIIGVYLFNFKMLKTSYDIFPHSFKSQDTLIRDPFFGKIC